MFKVIVIFILCANYALSAEAQNNGGELFIDHDTYVDLKSDITFEVDNSFYEVNLLHDSDIYEDINRYRYSPITTKRRGVEWWQRIRTEDNNTQFTDISQPITSQSIRLFSSTSQYRVGAVAEWSRLSENGWSVAANLYGRTGRDINIEGVFRNDISPTLTLIKRFDTDHLLSLTLTSPYQMRGLRSSATQECFDLTHSNLYNPSWGYYHGQIRNSRVVRNLLPSIRSEYQIGISASTLLRAKAEVNYGTRKLSRLGWYDSYNPSPNYYSKLPSYYEGSSAYESVVDVWQQNNSDYTQIAWDKLEITNTHSSDGESHYVVEDMVERLFDVNGEVMLSTNITNGLKVVYGACVKMYNRRNYKEMRDLLGGDYLVDTDQYAGDNVQVGNEMQNNLRDPNRKITPGDRFSYDYSYMRRAIEAKAKIDYRTQRLNLQLGVTLGEETIYRVGHYEKERFPSAASYGESQRVTLPTYNVCVAASYAIAPRQTVAVRATLDATAPLSRYMFVSPTNNNTLINNPTTEKIASATISYRYTSPYVTLLAQGYIISAYDMGQVWQGYDDMSSTYCNIVISSIATQSVGCEMCGEFNVGRNLKITSTFAVGGYTYSSSPLVTLYDDVDMSLVSQSQASTLKGYIVGNAPQITVTSGVTYFGPKGLILDLDLAYYAKRYVSPSIVRRTNRIISSATSVEGLEQMLYQEQLPDLVSGSISITKSFTLGDNNRITLIAKVDNILGDKDIISSAREGNRVVGTYSNDVTYGYTPQSSTYQYAAGRSLYLSLKYQF